MTTFAGKFELVPLFDGGRPVLRNGHTYYAVRNRLCMIRNAGDSLWVGPGQTTDLASIPPAVWWLFPPDGPWALAAVFHDVGYKSRGYYPSGGSRFPLTRAQVDAVLLEGMVALGVPAWKRHAIYWAVRAFGGAGWGT